MNCTYLLFIVLLLTKLSFLLQAESSTPLLQKSSASPRRWRRALSRGLVWPPRVSSTWPGRVGWMSAMLVGWETGVSVIPSTFVGRSAEEVCWGCEQFTSIPTRQDTHSLNPAMTASATQVQCHSDEERRCTVCGVALIGNYL